MAGVMTYLMEPMERLRTCNEINARVTEYESLKLKVCHQ